MKSKRKQILLLLLLLISSIILISCKKGDEFKMDQLRDVKKGDKIAIIKTNMGDIKIRLFPEVAPKTVENFETHSKNGYYDGLVFHRIIKDFMIQGGDPLGNGMGGESIWGQPFEDEIDENYLNLKGALSMANAGPNTNGSQFFIVQAPSVSEEQLKMMNLDLSKEKKEAYKEFGGTPWLDGKHTVFGQVYEGIDIVDKIAQVEVDVFDMPVKPVTIETIEISEYK